MGGICAGFVMPSSERPCGNVVDLAPLFFLPFFVERCILNSAKDSRPGKTDTSKNLANQSCSSETPPLLRRSRCRAPIYASNESAAMSLASSGDRLGLTLTAAKTPYLLDTWANVRLVKIVSLAPFSYRSS